MRRRDAIELRHAHNLVSSIPDCLENGCEGCRAEAAMALDVIEHLLRRHSRPWRRAVLPHPRSSGGAPEEAPPPATRYVGEQRTSDDEARIERAARALHGWESHGSYDDLYESERDTYREGVRAVIRALAAADQEDAT